MKIKFWMLATTLALNVAARAATNDLTGLLEKGLFDEEANRDLTAAIADYQSVASAFDKDRQLAATAIFRLGECYRKLDKSSEAAAQYQRIIKEFSDQPTLVTLSRQNLAGMGASTTAASSNGAGGPSEVVQQQIEQVRVQIAKDQAMLQTLQAMNTEKLRQTLPQLVPDPQLDDLIMRLNQAAQDLIKLKADYSSDHPKYKLAQESVEDLEKKVNERIEGIVSGVAARQESEKNYLEQLETQLDQHTQGKEQSSQQITKLVEQLQNDEKQLEELSMHYLPENSRVKDMQKRVESDRAALAQLTAKSGVGQPSGAADESANPVTDEEQTQIRNIQAMIQNSPDLINAPNSDGMTPLLLAAEKGQLVVAKYLLDHGADVNGRSRNHGDVPLLVAAGYGHKAMVELLLSRGADVSGGGLNPLYEAVKNGYQAVAEVLLANKADVNLRSGTDTSGMRPVHVAARDGRTEMLQLLIKHGADVNVVAAQDNTPLGLAASMDETNAAKLLLDSKADLAARDNNGNTALHVAAERGNTAMVSLLLDSGASVDATNGGGGTPLLYAVYQGRTDAARVLLEHKADPNRTGNVRNSDHNGWEHVQPVYTSIGKGSDEILKLVLDAGADPEGYGPWPKQPNPQFVSALFAAIDHNSATAVQLLLDHGANPNLTDGDGYSALSVALHRGKEYRIVSLLLAKGADANARGKDGLPPLFLAQNPEVARWLVEHKADVNARLSRGQTPLIWLADNSNMVAFLVDSGAKVDLQDTNGNTVLHYAVYYSGTASVALLLAHKANPNIQNDLGYTPRDMAEAGKQGQNLGPMMGFGNINTPPPKEPQVEIADLLTKAGGLVNLPKRNRIEVRRASDVASAFTKGTHDWNRYSLLELVAGNYGLLSQATSGEWKQYENRRKQLWNDYLRFPDFKNVVIYRRTDGSAKEESINVNVEDILSSGDCSRDVWLKWGDVIEIPESDHPVDQHWNGLTTETIAALTNCLARQVTIVIKGASTPWKLVPDFAVLYSAGSDDQARLTHASFMLRSVLDNSKLVRVSSDLSRVKVTRHDSETKKKVEWIIDCTNPTEADLWLRDGDVIDVPEKQ